MSRGGVQIKDSTRPVQDKAGQPSSSRQAPKWANTLLGPHPQQPAQVVARYAQLRVQTVALCNFEVAAVRSLSGLEVFDPQASLELDLVLDAQALNIGPVRDVQARIVFVHHNPQRALAV